MATSWCSFVVQMLNGRLMQDLKLNFWLFPFNAILAKTRSSASSVIVVDHVCGFMNGATPARAKCRYFDRAPREAELVRAGNPTLRTRFSNPEYDRTRSFQGLTSV